MVLEASTADVVVRTAGRVRHAWTCAVLDSDAGYIMLQDNTRMLYCSVLQRRGYKESILCYVAMQYLASHHMTA